MKFIIFCGALILFMPVAAQAQSSGWTMAFSFPASLDEVIQKLPRPVFDFVQSLHRAGNNLHFVGGQLFLPPAGIFPYGTPLIPQQFTAGSVFDFVKQLILFIGGFLVVILRVIASVIEWIVTAISQRFSS